MDFYRKIASNFGFELIAQIIKAVIGGILIIALARLLGSNEYGILFLAISVLGIAKFFSELGVAKSAARYISEYKENDDTKVPEIILVSFTINSICITVVVVSLLLFNSYISQVLGEPNLEPLLLIGVLYVIFSTLLKYCRFVFQGLEEIRIAALLESINYLSRLLFAIGLVIGGFGASGALFGYIIGFTIASGIGLVYLLYYYKTEITFSQRSLDYNLARKIWEYNLPIAVAGSAGRIDKQLDTVLVGFFLTPVAVSYYVLSKQVVEFIEAPVKALGFTISPSFGSKKATGDIDQISKLYEDSMTNTLLLYMPAAAGLFLISDPLIESVFGAEYSGAVPLIQILSFYAIFLALNRITSGALNYLGRARQRAIAKGATALLNLVLNIIFIPRLGVEGAAIATVITYGIYNFVNIFMMHIELRVNIKKLLYNISKIIMVTAIMVVPISQFIIFINGIVSLLIVVGIGVLLWAISTVLVGLVDIQKVMSKTIT